MSDDTEFEIDLDQGEESNEYDPNSSEIEIEEDEDDTSSQKPKNESNFKKLYKSHKDDQKRIKELEDKVNLLTQNTSATENTALDEDKLERLEKKAFLVENKEASTHIEKIVEVKNKYGMEYEDAWALVQAKLPKESKSSDDFDLKTDPIRVKKTLKDITPEEALKLPKHQLAQWQVFHGYASE